MLSRPNPVIVFPGRDSFFTCPFAPLSTITSFDAARPMRRACPSLLIRPAGCLAALAATTGVLAADWRTEVGWDDFKNEFAPVHPDGSGVLVLQAEADESTADGLQYLPNAASSELSGKTISPQTAGGNSSHALTVATRFYGNTTSMAPGVTDIHAWYAGDYLDSFGTVTAGPSVHCHAWIADFSSNPASDLASLDATIDANGFLVIGGLNNGSGTSVPHVFATTYNALSVGRSDGGHSRGGTIVPDYGPGRVKPEIVLPDTTTSWATGGASSLAAVLYQVAGPAESPAHPDAFHHSAVMKAIIMAGATKQEFDSWDRTTSRPLDEVFGVGEANLLNSCRILVAGQQVPGPVPFTGWSRDFVSDPPGPNDFSVRSFDFTIPATRWADDFSVVLNWNHNGTGAVRDLKLELFSLHGGTTLIDASNSSADNVEHIYRRNLPAGDYRLTVSRADSNNAAVSFGLAWQSRIGGGPSTRTAESIAHKPEVTITNIFKNRPYIIERSTDLQTWTVVHSFTPTTWNDYVWEDPAGYTTGPEVFYRSGFTP